MAMLKLFSARVVLVVLSHVKLWKLKQASWLGQLLKTLQPICDKLDMPSKRSAYVRAVMSSWMSKNSLNFYLVDLQNIPEVYQIIKITFIERFELRSMWAQRLPSPRDPVLQSSIRSAGPWFVLVSDVRCQILPRREHFGLGSPIAQPIERIVSLVSNVVVLKARTPQCLQE
jgi:hypothetical protein